MVGNQLLMTPQLTLAGQDRNGGQDISQAASGPVSNRHRQIPALISRWLEMWQATSSPDHWHSWRTLLSLSRKTGQNAEFRHFFQRKYEAANGAYKCSGYMKQGNMKFRLVLTWQTHSKVGRRLSYNSVRRCVVRSLVTSHSVDRSVAVHRSVVGGADKW